MKPSEPSAIASSAGGAIAELRRVLEEERQAIRKLDGPSVEAAARVKERVAEVLSALGPDELLPHAAELGKARAELRRNGVLLAHARTCLREAQGLNSGPPTRARLIEKRV